MNGWDWMVVDVMKREGRGTGGKGDWIRYVCNRVDCLLACLLTCPKEGVKEGFKSWDSFDILNTVQTQSQPTPPSSPST